MKRFNLTSILAAAAATAAGLVMITMAAQSAHAQVHAGGQRRLVDRRQRQRQRRGRQRLQHRGRWPRAAHALAQP